MLKIQGDQPNLDPGYIHKGDMGTSSSPIENIHITLFTTDNRLRRLGCHKYFYSATIQRVTLSQSASHTQSVKHPNIGKSLGTKSKKLIVKNEKADASKF